MTWLKKLGFKMFACGYCDLQHMQGYKDADFYNAGIYGWNCDIYVSWRYGVIITTGYRNMRGTWIESQLIESCTDVEELMEHLALFGNK